LKEQPCSTREEYPSVDGVLANDHQEVKAAAGRLGFPVALKICSENIPHKTERGGVALNITEMSSLDKAYWEMMQSFSDVPHAFLVQKMAQPGTELILGARRDPVFGPVVLVGIGGIFTEIFRDTALDLAPVDSMIARAMLRRLKGIALLEGYRSQKPLDIDAIAGAISALSRLISERPDILEIDVNPFIVYADGAVAWTLWCGWTTAIPGSAGSIRPPGRQLRFPSGIHSRYRCVTKSG